MHVLRVRGFRPVLRLGPGDLREPKAEQHPDRTSRDYERDEAGSGVPGFTLNATSASCSRHSVAAQAPHSATCAATTSRSAGASAPSSYLLASQTIDEQMANVLQRKRAVIDAVTDGQRLAETSALDAVVADLRRRSDRPVLRAAA